MGIFTKILFILLLRAFHPVHVSVTNVELNSIEKTITYSVRVYSEDVEYAIIHRYDREISLKEINHEEKLWISNYFSEALKIKLDDIAVESDLKDVKHDDDLIWFFFEGHWPKKKFKDVTVENKILLDLYFDQTNLLILTIDGNEKGFTFNYSQQVITFDVGAY
jgi:hypothetical protein